jgi:hypothetical protein
MRTGGNLVVRTCGRFRSNTQGSALFQQGADFLVSLLCRIGCLANGAAHLYHHVIEINRRHAPDRQVAHHIDHLGAVDGDLDHQWHADLVVAQA